MIRATCHCGAISIAIDTAPTEVTDCNCSVCRRYGVLWAYYAPRQVRLEPPDAATDIYRWGEGRTIFHRCRRCGCLSHWAAADPARDRMGVNARLMPPDVLARARVRHLDGADTWQYLD